MARPEGFEPPTTKFVAWYSIQLSYGREAETKLSASKSVVSTLDFVENSLATILFPADQCHPPERLELAEWEGFEPSDSFWPSHDFQSCPL